MRFTLACLALAAAASAAPQGVTSAISPQSSAPAGCQTSYSGTFEIETVNVTSSSKRSLEERQSNALQLSLSGGTLKDALGRTGYIAANNQFQFDSPPQTGAIYTAGWSVCGNGSLAIGGTVIFQQCLSGGFYNLYLNNNAPQCSPIYIQVISTGSGASGAVSQQSDGQPTATPVPICQLTDGQPQVTSCQYVTQISDGQIQATSAKPVTQISDGQIQATSAASAKPVTQISDGQIQATSAASAKPVTQISDGQIQATTAANPVTQISDGQIQATTAKNPVTQISDGQVQASVAKASATSSYRSPALYSGLAVPTNVPRAEVFGLAVGALAVALL